MSQANTTEAQPSPAALSAQRSAESLFHPGSIHDQLVQQISLLTQGMSEAMIFASGAVPEPEDDETQERPRYGYAHRKPKLADENEARLAARSRQLQDAARLSIATASLVGALARFNSQPGQRFTTRHTIVPDPTGKRKARRITTVTHTLFAPRETSFAGVIDIAPQSKPAANSK